MPQADRSISPRRATLIGAFAILMWGLLAALTVSLRAVPPFQLLAMAFGLAFTVGILWLLAVGGPGRLRLLSQPLSFWWDPLESTCRHASLSIL